MPELPEVETTVRGLRKETLGLKILDIWTDLNTKDKRKFDTISNPAYFLSFKNDVANKKILSIERRAKNILINILCNFIIDRSDLTADKDAIEKNKNHFLKNFLNVFEKMQKIKINNKDKH